MAVIGIDVSKHKLDLCWLKDPHKVRIKTKVFDNNSTGIEALQTWLIKQTGERPAQVKVMMEATGIYHEALAYALHEAGFVVYVTNPRHIYNYAKSFGTRSKNDRKDSVIIARYLQERQHERPVWQPEPGPVRHLRALLARLEALETDIQRENNRLEKAVIQQASARVEASIRHMIQMLEEERSRLLADIDTHIDSHPQLKRDRQLLESIPGIGRVVSMELLAVLRSRTFKGAGQAAAFVGVVPIMHQSGNSVEKRPRLSKTGSSRVRAKLYMSAVVAIRHNALIKQHFDQLIGRGKSKLSALGAAMRKLVQMAYGVLKHQVEYDPQWAT